MMQHFCRGTALATYNANVTQLYHNGKKSDVTNAQKAKDDYNDNDTTKTARLEQELKDAKAKTQAQYLNDPDDGAYMMNQALNEMMTGLLPNKVLQRVKRYLRREARKPYDMNIKSYYLNITHINSEEFLVCHLTTVSHNL